MALPGLKLRDRLTIVGKSGMQHTVSQIDVANKKIEIDFKNEPTLTRWNVVEAELIFQDVVPSDCTRVIGCIDASKEMQELLRERGIQIRPLEKEAKKVLR